MTTTKKTSTISCSWCKSTDVRDTGGIEWTGHAIYVCNSKGCGHEWVETSEVRKKSTFFDNIDRIIEDLFKK